MKKYIIYDGRANSGFTFDASILCVADSLEEAKEDLKGYPSDSCIYSYDVEGNQLVNEEFINLENEVKS